MKVIVNLINTDLKHALGVVKVIENIVTSLNSLNIETVGLLNSKSAEISATSSNLLNSFNSIVGVEEAQKLVSKKKSVELLPHHFTSSVLNCPSLVIVHDLHIYDIPWKYKNRDELENRFINAVSSASAVITHFPRTYYQIECFTKVTLKNLFLVDSPLMSQVSDQEPVPKPENLKNIKKYLLYPAQFQAHKGHLQLVKAYSDLKNQLRFDLVLVGSDTLSDPTKNNLSTLIKTENLSSRVHLLGFVSDQELEQIFADSCGVIVPSLAEGGAYVALEGIRYGKPIAVNKIEQAEMHLKQMGASAEYFSTENEKSIHQALKFFEKNNFTAKQVAKNSSAKHKIIHMNWDAVTKNILDIIYYCSGDRSKPSFSVNHCYEPNWNTENDAK